VKKEKVLAQVASVFLFSCKKSCQTKSFYDEKLSASIPRQERHTEKFQVAATFVDDSVTIFTVGVSAYPARTVVKVILIEEV
jgi:hypothetical protein